MQGILAMSVASLACRISPMQHIGDRIRERREELGLSQSEVARQLGLKPQSIQQWEDGSAQPRPKRYPEICRVLNVSRAWLVGGSDEGKMDNISPVDIVKPIPLISWVKAGQWNEAIDMYQPGYAEEWEKTTENVGDRAFALRVEGDSMEPDFPAGFILIVDPDVEPNPGDFVIAKVGDHATFKQFMQDAGHFYLKPLNARYPTLKFTEETSIAGVVVSATRRLRR